MVFGNVKSRILVALLLVIASKLLLYAGYLKGYSAYIVQPFLWFLAFFVLFDIVDRKGTTLYVSLLLASLNIGMLMIIGVISGWGLNSYDTSMYGVLLNTLRIIPYVFGIEYLRAAIFQRLRSHKTLDKDIIVLSIFFTALMISLSKFMLSLSSETVMLKLIISSLLPLFSLNLFLSYLLLSAGVWNTVVFSLTTSIFVFIAPVLPNIPWFIEGVVYTAMYLGLLLSTIIVLGETGIPKVELKNNTLYKRMLGIATYIITIIIFLAILVGGFKPFVIASGSMEPSINVGDLVLMSHDNIRNIRIGDIIAYAIGDRVVVHRVVEVYNESNNIYLKTKGDANRDSDPGLVTEKMFLGRILYTIPRIGIIVLGFQYVMVNYPFLLPATVVCLISLYAFLVLKGKDIRRYILWRWGI